MDPVALRRRNALRTGDALPTGQVITGAAPMVEVLDALTALPMPDGAPMFAPGGQGDCVDPSRVRRGVAVAAGFKNLMFSEGFDDTSLAVVTLDLTDGGAVRATVRTACAEVGQGFVTLVGQLVGSQVPDAEVVLAEADTSGGSAGSTSASRQTWMSGGAVAEALDAAITGVVDKVAAELGEECAYADGVVLGASGARVPLAEALRSGATSAERTFRHRATRPLGPDGQGDAHVSWAFVAHRAVVDVDLDLGTVALVQLATAQDVGAVLNPLAVVGQLEGGAAQGVGLALTEELALCDGMVTGPTFADYLIPTAVDCCDVPIALVTEPEPDAPWGAKGVGEPPNVSSTPAVVGALRVATGARADAGPRCARSTSRWVDAAAPPAPHSHPHTPFVRAHRLQHVCRHQKVCASEAAAVRARQRRCARGWSRPADSVAPMRTVLRGARHPGDVAIRDGWITEVGTVAPEPGDRTIGVEGDILTAGLVNTHHHLYQWMTRGRAVDSDLFGWLTELYPVWGRLDADDVHAAATVGLAELALSGCTTAADHHYVVPVVTTRCSTASPTPPTPWASAPTSPAVPWTSGRAGAGCRRTTWSRTSTRSSPPRTPCTPACTTG